MIRYLVEASIPADLPVRVYPSTGERIGAVPRFGLVEAQLSGRTLNPCDESCKMEIEPLLEERGLSLRDLCSRPRAPKGAPKAKASPPLGETGITTDLVEAATRRLLAAAGMPAPLMAQALPEIIGARLADPDKTVLVAYTTSQYWIGATKQVKAGVKELQQMAKSAAIAELAPLVTDDEETQEHNMIALQRLATVTTSGELTRDGQSWPVFVGAETDVLVASAQSLERLPARYVLAPMPAILPSNNPQSFSASPGYPPELQERDYQRDQLEKQKVIRNGDMWEPALVLNSNPDAVNGPPITDDMGRVLGGNSRAMSMMRFAAREPAKYAEALRKALREHCAAFGLDAVHLDNDTLSAMMLVRVIVGQVDARTISRALNRALTLELGRGASSVTLGKLIPDDVLAELANDASDSTLREILRNNSRTIIAALQRSGFITPQNQPTYVTRTNELTTRALADIEDALTGLVVGSTELYNLLKPRLLSALQRVAPALLAVRDTPYAEDAQNAQAALVDATAWAGLDKQQLGDLVRQTGLFAAATPLALQNVQVARWVLWWLQAMRSPAVAAKAARQFVELATRPPDMFSSGGRDEPAMLRALGMLPFEEFATLEEDWTAYVRENLPFEGLKLDRTRNPRARGPAVARSGWLEVRSDDDVWTGTVAELKAANADDDVLHEELDAWLRGGTSQPLLVGGGASPLVEIRMLERAPNPGDVFTPPSEVQEAAALALAVRGSKPKSQRGGTAVGLARARDLAHGRPVSRQTLQRMKAYFSRHQGDKRSSTWSSQGKGWQAWHMWGGDAGQQWAQHQLRDANPDKDLPAARRKGRTFTAEDVHDAAPSDAGDMLEQVKRSQVSDLLRGVGGWALGSEDAETARLGALLRALADELNLAVRSTYRGLTQTDQGFAHLYWAHYPPTDPERFQVGMLAATRAAMRVATGDNAAALELLSPKRRPNALPGWAETLIQVARLVTALSAAGSAGVALNRSAMVDESILSAADNSPGDEGASTGRP